MAVTTGATRPTSGPERPQSRGRARGGIADRVGICPDYDRPEVRWRVAEGELDLRGDGTVRLIETPGRLRDRAGRPQSERSEPAGGLRSKDGRGERLLKRPAAGRRPGRPRGALDAHRCTLAPNSAGACFRLRRCSVQPRSLTLALPRLRSPARARQRTRGITEAGPTCSGGRVLRFATNAYLGAWPRVPVDRRIEPARGARC